MAEQMKTNSLPFVVQYRRKDLSHGWIDMAAFDFAGPAQKYCQECSGDERPWEYRVDDRSSGAPR